MSPHCWAKQIHKQQQVISMEMTCHLVILKWQELCTLKRYHMATQGSGKWGIHRPMENEKQARSEKEKWLPSAREATPFHPRRQLWVMRKVHVLIEWKLSCAAPTSLFPEAEQPCHRRQSQYFSFTKKKWIHRHFINVGIRDTDDAENPSSFWTHGEQKGNTANGERHLGNS